MKISEEVVPALLHVIVFSIVIIATLSYVITKKPFIGPTLICLGMLPWIPIKLSGRTILSTGADILFGVVDTGMLGIAALIGASFAGVLGAILGGVAGDAITDAFAGIFEGKAAQYLRKRGIKEARTPLSAAMGKMSGCLIGIGVVLTIVWALLGL